MKLSDEQEQAAEKIIKWTMSDKQGFILNGYAGTGKTTLMKYLLPHFNDFFLAAPTGKAASVLKKKTGEEVKTIHSLLYAPIEIIDANWLNLKKACKENPDDEILKDKFLNYKGENGVDFASKNQKFSSNTIITVDEGSMIGSRMVSDLFDTGAKILMLGDDAQVRPVKDTAFFHNAKKDGNLIQVHRQAEGSAILRLATQVRKGEKIHQEDYEGTEVRICSPSDLEHHEWLEADQLLTDTNYQRRKLNRFIRNQLGYKDKGLLVENEKIICLKNDWNRDPQLINGVQCNVNKVYESQDEDCIWVTTDYDGMEVGLFLTKYYFKANYRKMPFMPWSEFDGMALFDYGYCITIHKSQGSEWPHVLLADSSCLIRKYRTSLDSRALLYTAITRASEKFTWVVR